jgi:hypothetical protein
LMPVPHNALADNLALQHVENKQKVVVQQR